MTASQAGLQGLVSVQELAAWCSVSEKTIRRRRRAAGIPWRSIHGDRWTEGDGPKRIAMREWHERSELDTRSVKA